MISKIEAKLRIFASPPVNIRRGLAEMSVKNQRLAYTSGIHLMGNLSAADESRVLVKKESSSVNLKAGGLIITMTN